MEEKQYDTDAIKEWLNDYRETERDIDNQIERLDRIDIQMTSISSPVISDMPRAPSPVYDRAAALVAMKVDLEAEIREAMQSQKKKRELIEEILKHIRSSDERAVIRIRYIDRASWYAVTDILFGGREDYLNKEETYLRRVHKIHGSALQNIAKYVDEHPISEIPSAL